MADITLPTITEPQTMPLRKVNPDTDLAQIADLIELSFGDQMDEDGQEYLRQIRRAAKNRNYINWVRGSNEWVPLPLHGYVYLEGERIIGNVSLVPFPKAHKWVYLICNVAVHPEFRRRGIGRILTRKGMDHIRQQKAQAGWLQVRAENLSAIHLYETEGFQTRAIRASWRIYPEPGKTLNLPTGYTIQPRRVRNWPRQQQWLEKTYPDEVAWNLPFDVSVFTPGMWKDLLRFVKSEHIENWETYRGGEMVGAVSWSESPYHMESLWPVTDGQDEDATLLALLNFMHGRLPGRYPVTINYPAGRGDAGFGMAGYRKQNTLIWMECPIE